MNSISIYEVSTGRILGSISSDGILSDQASQGEAEIEGIFDDTLYYILNGVAILRPPFPIVQIGNILTVPVDTEFSIVGPVAMEGIAETNTLDFEFSEPGTYTVTLRLFPYLDAEVTLEG
jgi:hypothetical protein